jgi:DNA-binding GntR family transcriptional regulator
MVARRADMEEACRRVNLEAYLATFWSFRDACYRCAERLRLERALADQRLRVERYILFLCRDVEAAAQLRQAPDRLREACRRRDSDAAERSTRDALLWVLEQLKTLLDDAERRSEPIAS